MADDWITIGSDRLTARINRLGAELSSLRDADGRELMTDADPAYWTGRAPLLFPIVGRLNGDVLRVDGQEYAMKQHGFARRMSFDLLAAGEGHVNFVLTDSEATRANYPFAFRLEVAFRLEWLTLAIDATVTNTGDVAMPASFGFHPAFAWPLPYGRAREAHRILFNGEEPDPLAVIGADGTIAPETRPTPLLEGSLLPLRDDLFARDALVWTQLRSDQLVYGAPDGPSLMVCCPDTPQLGIWTKPGARFVCIEPWHGHADPEGFLGEFRDKPGVFLLAPGEEKRIGMTVTLVEDEQGAV